MEIEIEYAPNNGQQLTEAQEKWERTVNAQPKDVQDKIKQVRKQMEEIRRK